MVFTCSLCCRFRKTRLPSDGWPHLESFRCNQLYNQLNGCHQTGGHIGKFSVQSIVQSTERLPSDGWPQLERSLVQSIVQSTERLPSDGWPHWKVFGAINCTIN